MQKDLRVTHFLSNTHLSMQVGISGSVDGPQQYPGETSSLIRTQFFLLFLALALPCRIFIKRSLDL
jgi:hypothetical protein